MQLEVKGSPPKNGAPPHGWRHDLERERRKACHPERGGAKDLQYPRGVIRRAEPSLRARARVCKCQRGQALPMVSQSRYRPLRDKGPARRNPPPRILEVL